MKDKKRKLKNTDKGMQKGNIYFYLALSEPFKRSRA